MGSQARGRESIPAFIKRNPTGFLSMLLMWAVYLGVTKQALMAIWGGPIQLQPVWVGLLLLINLSYTLAGCGVSTKKVDYYITYSRIPGFGIAAAALAQYYWQDWFGHRQGLQAFILVIIISLVFLALIVFLSRQIREKKFATALDWLNRWAYSVLLIVGLSRQVYSFYESGTEGVSKYYWVIMLVAYIWATVFTWGVKKDPVLTFGHFVSVVAICFAWIAILR